MRTTEILAIALGLMVSTAYSAPTGTINGRGPQSDTQPAEDAVNDAVNRLRPASALKSRGLQLDTRAPQDPVSDAINALRPGSSIKSRAAQGQFKVEDDGGNNNLPQASPPSLKSRTAQNAGADQDAAFDSINRALPASSRRSAQAPDAVFESIEQSLNPSGRRARSPQGQGRIEDNGGNNNLPQASPPNLNSRDAQAPDAVFESIEQSLNPSSRRRSPQVQGRIEDDAARPSLPQPNPPSLKSRGAQAPDAVFESIENSLNPSARRSAQGENRNENGIRPNIPQAQNQSGRKVRSAETASNDRGEASEQS